MAKNKKKSDETKWIIQIIMMSFCISLAFSFGSEMVLSKAETITGVIILIAFILFGILFDMVGTSVTACDIGPFNSMNARKVKGADVAVVFKKNAARVSTFCNDVVGDICGIISGSAGAIVSSGLSSSFNLNPLLVTLLVTACVASMTIGGKAIGKKVAIDNGNQILFTFAKIVSIFYKVKK